MALRVHHTFAEVQPADTAVVIDILRASTTIAVALHHGAAQVIPASTPADAEARISEFGRANVLLTGERNAFKLPGFDLGNSPLEFTAERVAGKVIFLTTTNGTQALLHARENARDVLVGSYVNFSVVLASVRSALRRGLDVAIVCAGSERKLSLEDSACAGRFVRFATSRPGKAGVPELNDGARAALLIEKKYGQDFARLFGDTEHGRRLRDAGFGDDLVACAALDAHPVLAAYEGGGVRAR